MKSALYSALFALLITNIICQDDSSLKELQELSLAMKSCNEADASKAKNCNDVKMPQDYHCCLVKAKGAESGCVPIDKNIYNDIDKYIKDAKDRGVKSPSIECSSNYIIISLLSLILLFL